MKHALLACIKNIDLVEFGHGFKRKICPNVVVILFRCIFFTHKHKQFVTRLSKHLWGKNLHVAYLLGYVSESYA